MCDATSGMVGIEVWGIYDGVLFWRCDECGGVVPRFTDPDDWRTQRTIDYLQAHPAKRKGEQ